MPRPKRTKVAPSGPRAKKPIAAPVVASTPVPPSFDDMYDVSDQEKASRSARNAKSAKGKGIDSARKADANENVRDNDDSEGNGISGAIEQGVTSLELDLDDDDMRLSSSPHLESGRRERRTPAMDNSVLAIGNFRRRAREPSILGRRTARARSSSVESEIAEDDGLTSVGKKNNTVLNRDASTRRGRQLSTTRGRAGSVGPSSAGLDMDRPTPRNPGSVLRLGTFKRRAREPSILGTGRKPQQPRPEFDSDSDDFMPEDESTPLNLSKMPRVVSSSSGSAPNSRKRKLSTVQVPRSQDAQRNKSSPSLLPLEDSEPEDTIPATGPLQSDEEEAQPDAQDAEEMEVEPESSSRDSPLSSIERPVTPEAMSETMAPPHSSSPSIQSPPSPPLPQATRPTRSARPTHLTQASARPRRIINPRTPPPLAHMESSPISSPPSLTHSPDLPARSKSKRPTSQAAPLPAALPTAALQALLPRRRQRHRSTLDVEESDSEVDVTGLGDHEDELTIAVHPASRASTRTQNSKSKPAPAAKEKGKARRTYGKSKSTTSDKENEQAHDPDDSLAPLGEGNTGGAAKELRTENSQELEKRVGKELKNAAKKFKEVDKWELEFEDAEASSDRGAR
ncbi:hypothetical protein ACMFMG_004446 [Clarireedia jacksonii]